MFSELNKYKQDGFLFKPENKLSKVCNAPDCESGVYLIYAVNGKKNQLVYIGKSGRMEQNGIMQSRKDGIKGRLINGHHKDTKTERYKIWNKVLVDDEIDYLKVEWYITFDGKHKDIPAYIESKLLQIYFNDNGCLPLWNKAI
ncbi:MAG: hypothetical protein POELPBGB_03029 [Bacteroidia bacterium]|nr:hypothetical protein [Bacteroidia bacterium]